MFRQLQPLVSLVKNETPTVIKNEPPESEIVEIGINDILDSSESEEEIIPDVKDIDIVYHPICEDLIKSEILESKQYESEETQVLVNAENSPFIKTEITTQRDKTEDTRNKNVSKGTGQEMVEVQGSNKHSNVFSNLETDKHVPNFSDGFNGISLRSRKAKQPEKTNFVNCYKTVETTLLEKHKEKVRLIKAPVIPFKPHEYTSLAKDKHVCNHCQHTCNKLENLKLHIRKMHREVTTMYQCAYCPYKSKWSVKRHIIQKHKDTKEIQWFQCHLCEKKFKLKSYLTEHMKVHLKHKQMKDGLDLRYSCDKCDYKTYLLQNLTRHKLTHLKSEHIQYFYCYHCSFKSKRKDILKTHIFRHFKNENVPLHCYICDFMTPKRDLIVEHVKNHSKHHSKLNDKGTIKINFKSRINLLP